MSSGPYKDAGAYRIKRKPPPPFPYSTRYPQPDPSDPFAPLSVLRDRTATLTNSPYELPVAIPDTMSGSSRVLDLATFITHQREKSAALGSLFGGESGWQGHMSQLRKGTSMGPGLHEYSSGTNFSAMASSTLRPGVRETQRCEARRRSQSVFALRSGTFSFLESCPPRSCSSSFVSATVLDGVPEVPTCKSLHAIQVDMPPTGAAENRSLAESPPPVLPPPLEKRNPSDSSTGSWSRDLVFYSAHSRPQTPSSIRSSRPVSLPPSATLSFPFVPPKPALFTPSPVTSSTHNATATPSNHATSFPPNNSDSHRVSMPPEGRDVLPQLNVRFPRRGQLAESEPESVERESGRFARLRARTSAALQTRRSSTSSSLRSTLWAAAEAADKLAAAEDAGIASHPPVTPRRVTQAPVVACVSESPKVRSLATGTPESKKPEECHPVDGGQFLDTTTVVAPSAEPADYYQTSRAHGETFTHASNPCAWSWVITSANSAISHGTDVIDGRCTTTSFACCSSSTIRTLPHQSSHKCGSTACSACANSGSSAYHTSRTFTTDKLSSSTSTSSTSAFRSRNTNVIKYGARLCSKHHTVDIFKFFSF